MFVNTVQDGGLAVDANGIFRLAPSTEQARLVNNSAVKVALHGLWIGENSYHKW